MSVSVDNDSESHNQLTVSQCRINDVAVDDSEDTADATNIFAEAMSTATKKKKKNVSHSHKTTAITANGDVKTKHVNDSHESGIISSGDVKTKPANDSHNAKTKPVKRTTSAVLKRIVSIDENGSEVGEPSLTAPTDSQLTPHMKDRFRRKLRYYFMSPIDKWKAKRRLPFKLLIQVFKIILVTLQLIIYGYDMSNQLAQESNVMISFQELFLDGWDPVREVVSYPPTAGPYAIYTIQKFYDSVDFSIQNFANISALSIGSFGYAIDKNETNRTMSDIIIRRHHYKAGNVEPSNYLYDYNNVRLSDELVIPELYPANDTRWLSFSSHAYFDSHKFKMDFDRLIRVELVFQMRTVYLNSLAKYNAPKCYDLNITITYDNGEHDGQMLINLATVQRRHQCNGKLVNSDNDDDERLRRNALNWAVIVFCCISFGLCVRSLYSGQLLRRETQQFFGRHLQKSLSFGERMEFTDLWIVLIIVNDTLITTATLLQMKMESMTVESIHYNTISLLLGVGNLCVWGGLLRYLAFFHKYNILILTLRKAIPNVLRFLMCTILLYGGFGFCGWVVLGPYHLKFRTPSRSFECLFSLMNGDDMFATFFITDTEQELVWWFSRIYIYLFVCLFIYVVLSLFIALIMDSYETVKDYYKNGVSINELQKFIAECKDESSSRAYLEDRQTSIVDTIGGCFSCFNLRRNYNNV